MAGGNFPSKVCAMFCMASPICLRLLLHCVCAAASRTFWTAGRSRPIRMAMMAITTKSSIRVKPDRSRDFVGTGSSLRKDHAAGEAGHGASRRARRHFDVDFVHAGLDLMLLGRAIARKIKLAGW